jgi:hypothetical protein
MDCITPPPPDSTAPAAAWADYYASAFDWLALPANGKLPIGPWGQTILDHEKLRARWAITERRYGPVSNLALVTGARSQVIIGDVDPRHGGCLETLWELSWPADTVIARTGGEQPGWHVYLRPSFEGLPSLGTYAEGVELKGNGSITVLPPSVHPATGNRYSWLPGHAPWEIAVATVPAQIAADVWGADRPAYVPPSHEPGPPLPADLAQRRVSRRAQRLTARAVSRARYGVDGGRHNSAVWLACQLRDLRVDDALYDHCKRAYWTQLQKFEAHRG